MALSDLTSLISYWRLNEASGDRIDAHGSNDLSDNGTVTQEDGRIGNTSDFLLDSAGFVHSNTEYLDISDNSDISAGDIDFTIAGWFFLSNISASRPLVSHWRGADNERSYIVYFNIGDGDITFGVSGNGTAQTYLAATSYTVVVNQWFFLVAWHDATSNEISIQIDNGAIDSTAFSDGVNDSAADFAIGAANGTSLLHSGRAQGVGFWKRILSSDDRNELWNSSMGLDYPFDGVQLANVGSLVVINARSNNTQNAIASIYATLTQWTNGGTTYEVIGYWDLQPNSNLVIGKRVAGGAWTLYEMNGSGGRPTITISADDNHHSIGVGIDPNGYIHVSYDMHNDPLLYRKSDAAINSWTGGMTAELSMVGTNESNVTYPTFFNDPAGILYFMFRDGVGANGDLYFYEYDESGTNWSAATGTSTGGLLIEGTTGGTTYNPYWSQPPVFDSDFGSGGYMHIAWVWRGAGGANDNHNVAYVRWNGTSWTQADATSQTVPITDANDEVAHTVAASNGLGAFPSIYSDSNGNPHISFKKEDGSGYEQVYHVYHNGSSWSTPVALTSWDQGFSAGIEDPKSVIAIDRSTDEAYVVFLAYGEGTGLFYYHSVNYSSWSKETITTTQFGYWQPQFNHIYWNANTEFQFSLAPYLTINTTGVPIRILTDAPVSSAAVIIPRPGVAFSNGVMII